MKQLLKLSILFYSILFYSTGCQDKEQIGNITKQALTGQQTPIASIDIEAQPTKALAIGLAGAVHALEKNPDEKLRTFNRIVVKEASRGLDGYYWVYLQQLMDLNAEAGIDLKGLMNTTLQRLAPNHAEEDIVETILTNTATTQPNKDYHIVVPYLDIHLEVPEKEDGSIPTIAADWDKLANDVPIIGYNSGGHAYPMDIVSVVEFGGVVQTVDDLIDKGKALSFLSLFLTADSAPECYIDGEFCNGVINACYASAPDCNNCIADPPLSSTLPRGSGNGFRHHELTIILGEARDSRWGDERNDEYCEMEFGGIQGSRNTNNNYAVLKALHQEYNFYTQIEEFNPDRTSTGTILAQKLDKPIRLKPDGQPHQEGHTLKLCENESNLFTYDEGGAVSMGGVYRLSQWGLPPLYFVIPFGEGLWYTDGPDMRLYYGYQKKLNQNCPEETNVYDVSPYYEFRGCAFCDIGGNKLGINSNVVATTDYSIISNYWKKSSVSVGVGYGDNLKPENIRTVNSNTTMQPVVPTNIGNLIASLIKRTDGSYEITKLLANERQSGDEIIMHVFATFENGDVLNHFFELTLSGPTSHNIVRSCFTGKIKNYNIEIFDMQ